MPKKKSTQPFSDMVPFMLVLGIFCAISIYLLSSFFVSLRGHTYQANILVAEKPVTGEPHAMNDGYIFKDVPYSHENATAILYFRDMNIIMGYDDGEFKPKNGINRAELLKILVMASGVPEAEASDCFADVPADVWFAVPVCTAKLNGWVGGYDNGTFGPANPVTKVEAVKMSLLAFGFQINNEVPDQPFVDTPIDHWYTPYLYTALQHNLLQEVGQSEYHPGKQMTRAGIVELMYRAMDPQPTI
jgi:hypothetical protein